MHNIIAVIPIVLPNIESNTIPDTTPNDIPRNWLAKSPMHKIYITKILGFTPAIVKYLKK